MISDVPKFIDIFCSGDKMQKNEEQLHHPHEGAVRHPAPARAEDRRGGGQGRQQLARALRQGRQGVLRPLGEVRGDAAPQQPAPAVRQARRDRGERRTRLPGGPPGGQRHPRAHGAAQPAATDGQERAGQGRHVQDRRQLAGHRRLRPGRGLVRALRQGEPAPQGRGQGALATPSSCASASARKIMPSPT